MPIPLSLLLTVAAVFTTVALLVGTAASAVLTSRATRRRLLEVTRGPGTSALLPDILPLSSEEPVSVWTDIGKWLPR